MGKHPCLAKYKHTKLDNTATIDIKMLINIPDNFFFLSTKNSNYLPNHQREKLEVHLAQNKLK